MSSAPAVALPRSCGENTMLKGEFLAKVSQRIADLEKSTEEQLKDMHMQVQRLSLKLEGIENVVLQSNHREGQHEQVRALNAPHDGAMELRAPLAPTACFLDQSFPLAASSERREPDVPTRMQILLLQLAGIETSFRNRCWFVYTILYGILWVLFAGRNFYIAIVDASLAHSRVPLAIGSVLTLFQGLLSWVAAMVLRNRCLTAKADIGITGILYGLAFLVTVPVQITFMSLNSRRISVGSISLQLLRGCIYGGGLSLKSLCINILLWQDMYALERLLVESKSRWTVLAHRHIHQAVNQTQRRWSCFLVSYLLLSLVIVFAWTSWLYRMLDSLETGLFISLCGFYVGIAVPFLELIRPMIRYNQAVKDARANAQDFQAYMMFLTHPLEFRFLGLVIEPRTFKFIVTGVLGTFVRSVFHSITA